MINRWQKIRSFLVHNIFGHFAYFSVDSAFFAYLEESDPLSKTPKIQLTGIPENSILLKMDRVQEGESQDVTQPLFLVDGKHLRHRCDYILLTHLENKDTVIFFELKSKNIRHCEVTGKFKTSACLLNFIADISESFFNHNISFSPSAQIVCRYVLVYVPDKSLKFSNNMPRPRVSNCSADNYFEYPAISSGKSNLRVHYTELVKI